MSEENFKIIFHSDNRERLDTFLTQALKKYSRSRIQTLIKNGNVKVNDVEEKKSSLLLDKGMPISITIPAVQKSDLIPEDILLDIVFENGDLLVVNKPSGMVVHPAPGHDTGTLVHAALGYVTDLAGIGGQSRPGIVHRLDKGTSGLIIIAKNDHSLHWLQEQFKSRMVEKTYLTLVDGKPPTDSGRVDAPIGRNHTHRKLMAIVPINQGREAISEYHTLEKFENHSFLQVHPLTGRTHQIRVHMAFLGCPVVGDTVYGRKKPTVNLNRHFLHAFRLTIALPDEKEMTTFQCNLPTQLSTVLSELRTGSISDNLLSDVE